MENPRGGTSWSTISTWPNVSIAPVFGWTFPIAGPDFVVVFDGTEQIGQLYASSEQVSGRGIRMYFDTDDLEGILAKVASAGGIVKTERTPISPEMG